MRRVPVAATLGMVFAFIACEPEYQGLEMRALSSPPTAVTVSDDGIEITSGVAVVVRVSPLSRTHTVYKESDEVTLLSEDEEVFAVVQGQHPREFALAGIWPGETRVVVKVNGRVCDHIQARCTPYQGDAD
jgi:hypothetical protein